MRGLALRLAGRLVEATETSQDVYTLALERRSAQTAAVEATSLGFIWLARGSVRTALRRFRESASLLRDADPSGMLAWALAGMTQAAAQAGEATWLARRSRSSSARRSATRASNSSSGWHGRGAPRRPVSTRGRAHSRAGRAS